jgi:hypothetical protein
MGTKVVINTRYQGHFELSIEALTLYAQRKGGVLKMMRRSDYIEFPDGRMFTPKFNDRTDADLVAVIEELGTEVASNEWCRLEIVTIPDDVTQWFISEGDGDETVYEGWQGRELDSKKVMK